MRLDFLLTGEILPVGFQLLCVLLRPVGSLFGFGTGFLLAEEVGIGQSCGVVDQAALGAGVFLQFRLERVQPGFQLLQLLQSFQKAVPLQLRLG